MAVRKIVQIGHPALKVATIEVTDFGDPKLAQVIEDLKDTMYAARLIGIAATQIGEGLRVFLTEPRETDVRPADQADELKVYINPTIVYQSPEKSVIWEGCGSFYHAEQFGPVVRPRVIEIEASDQSGQKFRFKADGILGRAIQHEMDHLDSKEFVDRMTNLTQLKPKQTYIDEEKNKPEHLAAQKISIKECRQI